MKTIELKIVCKSCNGTGLYSGMGEHDGAAVVCHNCNGTGCFDYTFEYEDFVVRKERRGIKRVFECNPGIGIGKDPKQNLKLEDFGGMPYKEWEAGLPFPKGSEMRKYTCPKWWHQQSANYRDAPEWDECYKNLGRSFSDCKYFKTKEKCWERFDKENANERQANT